MHLNYEYVNVLYIHVFIYTLKGSISHLQSDLKAWILFWGHVWNYIKVVVCKAFKCDIQI